VSGILSRVWPAIFSETSTGAPRCSRTWRGRKERLLANGSRSSQASDAMWLAEQAPLANSSSAPQGSWPDFCPKRKRLGKLVVQGPADQAQASPLRRFSGGSTRPLGLGLALSTRGLAASVIHRRNRRQARRSTMRHGSGFGTIQQCSDAYLLTSRWFCGLIGLFALNLGARLRRPS
jgi:hypothetical protein